MRNIAIILASGTGSRLRAEVPKQFLKLAGKTVLEHTLGVFDQHLQIDEVIVVCAEEHRMLVEELIAKSGIRKVARIVRGGATRQESSASGIAAIVGDDHKVLVHDAARPLLDHPTIDRCLAALDTYAAVDTGIPSGDTIIQLNDDDLINSIPVRSKLRLGQTPQAFRSGVLREAHRLAVESDDKPTVTDDCGLVLHYNLTPVKVVDGSVNNIKITYPSDIYLADRLFQLRAREVNDMEIGDKLKEKNLVVFGASRGIGKAIAVLAKEHKANVMTFSRQTGVDVTNAGQVREALAKATSIYGKIDMVINTAGVLRTGLVSEQEYSSINEQIETNFQGSLIVAKESFEVMRELGGSITLFASSSYTRGRARSSVYSATKAAVVNLMQGLAEEYSPFGVSVNAINPERTATPMRTQNFGNEPPGSLLDALLVARTTLVACAMGSTGEVIDVRR